MIRVVIDTSVFIRYLIRPSAAIRTSIEDLWITDAIRVVTAPELIVELEGGPEPAQNAAVDPS